jgi:methyltransferase
MGLSVVGFLGLLAAVALLRLIELGVSARNRALLMAQGAADVADPHFRWMVFTHVAVLAGAALEVILLRRPFLPALAWTMLALFLLANGLRWWVIQTLKMYWTVRVTDSARIGVVAEGPFRCVRHPNYTAVFIELVALPLIHSAWVTALAGSAAHVWVLSRRLAVEEPLLLTNPVYLEKMAWKPRFLPHLF